MLYSPSKEFDRQTYQILLDILEIAVKHGKASQTLPYVTWMKKRLESHNYAIEDYIYHENSKTLAKRLSTPHLAL